MAVTRKAFVPAVKKRIYCATCHALVRLQSYPAREVELAPGDEPNIPQPIAMVHVLACPRHK
jgi:hypothetical protein